jgi:hypothetical protein
MLRCDWRERGNGVRERGRKMVMRMEMEEGARESRRVEREDEEIERSGREERD